MVMRRAYSCAGTRGDHSIVRKEKTLKRTILLIGALLIAAAGCGVKDDSELVVAAVETRQLTVADFEGVAETIDEKYLPETNDLEGKKKLLDHMINKEVMALKAFDLGYDKDEWFVNLWDQYRGSFLIAQLMDFGVARNIEVNDDEVAEYYREMHYEYTISQIVVANEDEIVEIRDRAVAGEDFAELAKKHSLGMGAEDGGFVGGNPIGRIHWWVEEELFKLEPGDISQPLRTSSGWAIIKLHKKRKVEPINDEVWAEKRVTAIKQKKAMEELKAQIELDIGLQFFTDAVNIAFDGLPEDIDFDDILKRRVTRSNAPRLNIPEKFKDKIICQYSDGSYTLADFEEIYYRMGLPERPRRQYGRDHIIQTMKKIIYDKILPVYAEETAKVLEIPEVKKNYDSKMELFLVQKLYEDHIKDEVTLTFKDQQEYYAANLDNLLKMEMRDFSVIIVPDHKTASNVYKQAREGVGFHVLVGKYSVEEGAKESLGRTGLHVQGNMTEYDEIGFALDGPGAISEPFQTPRGWAVLKVEEVEDERVPTFAEAQSTIKKTLLEIKYEEHLNMKLEKWRQDYKIEIFDKNLERAELTRTRL
jgi:parvulin-like peptidyl-prolyl isomerase